jgi:hypothetical protein
MGRLEGKRGPCAQIVRATPVPASPIGGHLRLAQVHFVLKEIATFADNLQRQNCPWERDARRRTGFGNRTLQVVAIFLG